RHKMIPLSLKVRDFGGVPRETLSGLSSQVLPAAYTIGAVDPSVHAVIEVPDIADLSAVHVCVRCDGLDFREARVFVALDEPERQLDVVSLRNSTAEADPYHEDHTIPVDDHRRRPPLIDHRPEPIEERTDMHGLVAKQVVELVPCARMVHVPRDERVTT